MRSRKISSPLPVGCVRSKRTVWHRHSCLGLIILLKDKSTDKSVCATRRNPLEKKRMSLN
jgi:hypothetical protein